MWRDKIISLLAILTFWTCGVAAQEGEDLISGKPLSFEIKPGDPVLKERGPGRAFDYAASGRGTIFVYAVSKGVPLFLGLRSDEDEVLAEEDGDGGVRSPCIKFEVSAGQALRIVVSATELEKTAQASLHLFEAPETEKTLAAAEALDDAIEEAASLAGKGDREAARQRLADAVEAALDVAGATESSAVMNRLWVLGDKSDELGDLPTTRAARSVVHAFREKNLPEDHPDLQRARGNLALTLKTLGDFQEARALQEKVLAVYSRILPEDHPDLQKARLNLAVTIKAPGDLQGARALEEKVLAIRSRTLPDDHPELQAARQNLAVTMSILGDLHGARVLQEKVLEVRSQTLPDDHPDLQDVRMNLAVTIKALGDLQAARMLFEKVLAVRSHTLPEDHPDLQSARQNLAVTIKALGNLHAARALEEKVLEVRSRTLPDDHPELQAARQNLAVTMSILGDLHGARVLQEKVLEVRSRTLPDDHPDLQSAKLNLAATIADLGYLHAARALEEKVLEVRSHTLPEDHPDLQSARQNLAVTIKALGNLHAARALEEKVLEVRSRTLPDDHPELQAARQNLAVTMHMLDELPAAKALFEKVLEVYTQSLPDDHPGLQRARGNLAETCLRMREIDRTVELSRDLTRGVRGMLAKFEEFLASRELEVMAIEAENAISQAVSWMPLVSSEEELPETFSLIETVRAAGATGSRHRRVFAAVEIEKRASELRDEIQKASADVVRLSRGDSKMEDLFAAVRRKDGLERALREHLAPLLDRAGALPKADADAIAAELGPSEAAVGYWRYRRFTLNRESGSICGIPSYLAFVLRPGEVPQRIELGEAKLIEEAVKAWRKSILAPVQRGITILELTPSIEETQRAHGEVLRRLIFDPLLPAIGDAKRIMVALDDVMHLVPLDALPEWKDKGSRSDDPVVGDRLEIIIRTTLKELTLRRSERSKPLTLLVFGGIDYDGGALALTGEKSENDVDEEETDSALSLIHAFRGAPKDLLRGEEREWVFTPLPSSGPEAEAISEVFGKAFTEAKKPWCFKGRAASRDALEVFGPRAWYLHIATHGYFAPESVPSMRDERPVDEKLGLGSFGALREQVRGFAPMVLCGLALAGANTSANEYGRVPGLMTAEEITGLDLAGCELCVLSACDTNVGIRRAGQGIASMQQALWAAGARTAITSLWKVSDEATRELMTDFYRRLWMEQKPKAQALWEAKCKLRRAKDAFGEPRYKVRDWAGWVLTGEP